MGSCSIPLKNLRVTCFPQSPHHQTPEQGSQHSLHRELQAVAIKLHLAPTPNVLLPPFCPSGSVPAALSQAGMGALAPLLNYEQGQESVFLSKEAQASQGTQDGPLKDEQLCPPTSHNTRLQA